MAHDHGHDHGHAPSNFGRAVANGIALNTGFIIEVVFGLPAGSLALVADAGHNLSDAPALMQADVGVAMEAGTDIAIESADIIVGNCLRALLAARDVSRHSFRTTEQNVVLAFLFNGLGIPLAATGLVYPVWAMVAMALSVSTIFANSLWGRPSLFFDAVLSVGRARTSANREPENLSVKS